MAAKCFKVDAWAVISLGRDSIKDHVTAVVELVKNSYDAGAHVVEVELAVNSVGKNERFIRISDDGSGMDEDDVGKN